MLMSMNDYNDFEFCLTPDNPAVRMARKTINKICIPRAAQEDRMSAINPDAPETETHTCKTCIRHRIKTQYLKSEMMIIIRTYRKGKQKEYYCPWCAEKYKPVSQRVGGQNF